MPNVSIVLNAEIVPLSTLAELYEEHPECSKPQKLVKAGHLIYMQGQPMDIGVMPNGTEQGNPVVMIAFKLPDGRGVLVETTLKLFLTAADAFRTKYGDLLI